MGPEMMMLPEIAGMAGTGTSSGSAGSGGLGDILSNKNLLGAGVSGAMGLLQLAQASSLKKQANNAMPDYTDPMQASYLAELNQKRKSIGTGADYGLAVQNADSTQGGANDAILRAGGGDTGSTMQALLQAQQTAGASKNQALANDQAQQFSYDSAYGNTLSQIAGRKMELQLLDSQQKRAEWAQKNQQGNQNLNAGIMNLLAGIKPKSGAGTPTGSTTPDSRNLIAEGQGIFPGSADIASDEGIGALTDLAGLAAL